MLLEKGADVNALGGRYGNALQAASWQHRTEVVALLLEKGADVNARGGRCGNALEAATIAGFEELREMLLTNRAQQQSVECDIHASDDNL